MMTFIAWLPPLCGDAHPQLVGEPRVPSALLIHDGIEFGPLNYSAQCTIHEK